MTASRPPESAASRSVRFTGGDDSAYGTTFWLCYSANLAMMIAVSLLFRYADFVRFIGGSELDLGLIVGVGMVGALLMRTVQGPAIDRYGPRIVWLLSMVLFTIACLCHLSIQRADGPGVYFVRMMLSTSTAGAFGASLTYVSLRAPPGRMAEMLGSLGTSGFVGLALGPVLGDFLFAGGTIERTDVRRMFLLAAAMGVVSLALTFVATREPVRRPGGNRRRRSPPLFALVRRYHPGMMLLLSAAMGFTLGLPTTFVRAFAAELSIDRIKVFFLVYAGSAFLIRILTRKLADQAGVRPVVLWGFGTAAVSMLLYLPVTNEWLLAIPAIAGGIAHAFLFPAVIAGGNATFPARYRGIATTLSLAMFDIGSLIGQPAVGGLIGLARRLDWPAYTTMFVLVAGFLAAVAVFYAWQSRPRRPAATAVPVAASGATEPRPVPAAALCED